MKSEDKAKWIAALRSDQYKQARGTLCKVGGAVDGSGADGMCCLGVLLDVLKPLGGRWGDKAPGPGIGAADSVRPFIYTVHTDFGPVTHYDDASPGENLRAAIGLPCDSLGLLIGLNDTDKKTFPEIADWIDQHISVE